MELTEIKMIIERIKYRVNQNDDEYAHIIEEDLYFKFIKYVAKVGDEDLKKKAKAVLKSSKIPFRR